jgi:hypothetical protein
VAANPHRVGPALAGILGLLGGLVCAAAMILPALGVAGAGVVGMARMTSGAGAVRPGGLLGFLLSYGPALILISTVAFTASIGLRRPIGTWTALLGGLVMYWGMYGQAGLTIMYATIVLGIVLWVGLYVWAGRARGVPRSS